MVGGNTFFSFVLLKYGHGDFVLISMPYLVFHNHLQAQILSAVILINSAIHHILCSFIFFPLVVEAG